MRCCVAIFAKYPLRGQVKTRLSPPLTLDEATELYRAFLLDTMHLVSEIHGIEPCILFAPAESYNDFRALALTNFLLVPQTGTDFGERINNGFRDLFGYGFDSVAIMDADSPTLPRAHVSRLFEQLSDPGCDVSVGPSDDGGYWAIGMKQWHRAVLSGIPWSTERVLQTTLERARDARLTAACAPAWYDVDDASMLERLYAEQAANPAAGPYTRRTLAQLGLPDRRVEAMRMAVPAPSANIRLE